ncbi:hypothetical protein Esti_004924 [Eimeria stiedai]
MAAPQGPLFGLHAAPRPSWLEDEAPAESGQQTTGHTSSSSSRAYVYFTTSLPEPFKLPQEPLSVETSFRRADLSKLVNRLLQEQAAAASWPGAQPLDFFVDGKTLLRGSLGEKKEELQMRIFGTCCRHMQRQGLTAELSIHLEYELATLKGKEAALPPAPDWISGLSTLGPSGPVVAASYDGSLRVYSHASMGAFLSGEGPPSAPHEVYLQQGPLVGVACVGVSEGEGSTSVCLAATQGGGLLSLSLTNQGSGWRDSLSFAGCQGGPASCIATSADALLTAVGGTDGVLTIWGTAEAAAAAQQASAAAAAAASSRSSSGRQKRRVFAANETVGCSAMEPSLRLPAAHQNEQRITAIAFPGVLQGEGFVSAGLDSCLKLWNAEGGESASYTCTAAPLSVSWRPNESSVLAAAHEDGRVRLWDVRTPHGAEVTTSSSKGFAPQQLVFKARHARLPGSVSWSSSPHLLASAGQDGCVLVYDVRSPAAALVVFKAEAGGLPARLLCCSWLGDGAVVSGGSDGRVRIHGIVSGDRVSNS